MARVARALSIITAAQGVVILALGLAVSNLALRPPVVLDQNDGYVMWRTTEFFKLRPDNIRSFCRIYLGTLFTVSPGSYDIAPALPLMTTKLAKLYREQRPDDAIVNSNQRRIFILSDARRWSDPEFPSIVCIAARGERALYEVTPNAQQSFKIESSYVVYLLYVKNIPPTPENPWGLLVHGFKTLEGQDADRVWNEAIPLQVEEESPAKKKEKSK